MLEGVGLALPGLAPAEGARYAFTLDTTASVNLLTKEVSECVCERERESVCVCVCWGLGLGVGSPSLDTCVATEQPTDRLIN